MQNVGYYAETPVEPRQRALINSNFLVGFLLILTMLVGGAFRFVGVNWDDYVGFHPDERFLTSFVAAQFGRGWLSFSDGNEVEQAAYCDEQYPDTDGVGGFFDARCSDMNPHNLGAGHFVYGTLPAFAAYGMGTLLDQINDTAIWTNADRLTLLWRMMSACYDTLVILVVFLAGTKLRNKWVGLIAAALYAGAVLPIQVAHFGTADGMTTLWVALTLLFSIRAQADGRWWDFAAAGAAFGAALASRFNVFPLVIVIMFAALMRMMPAFDGSVPSFARRRAFIDSFSKLALAGIVTLLVFRVCNPYAFVGPGFLGVLPNQRWLDDLSQARFETSSANDNVPNWQWAGRTPYVFAFTNMVLWGMGAAFGITGWLAWVWAGWRIARGKVGALKYAPLVLWILVYFGWVGGNFVMSMRYYLPLYPAFALLAGWALVELASRGWKARGRWRTARRAAGAVALVGVVGLTLLWAAMFTNIYRHMATFTQLGQWTWQYLPGDFAMTIEGAPETINLINIPLVNSNGITNNNLSNSTHLFPNLPVSYTFTVPASGVVSSIFAPRIGAVDPSNTTATLRFRITSEDGAEILAEAELADTFRHDENQVGDPYTIPLDQPLAVEQGERYTFTVEVASSAALATSGTIVTWEGAWDEPVPPQVCTLPVGMALEDDPPPGLLGIEECNRRNASATLVTTNQLDLTREDEEYKRVDMLRVLDSSDYIMIGTNRRYDSQSRNPARWPLTNHYYEALFSGELGFELIETFHESFELGPLRVSDQYLPTYDAPEWLNEYEAEEAFTVYDHPTAFVFRKSDDYDPQVAADILYDVPLTRVYDAPVFRSCPEDPDLHYCDTTIVNVATLSTEQASDAPTMLMFTDDMRAIQYDNGTWSDRFDSDSPVNTNAVASVAAWWIVVTLCGLAVFPLLFVLLPALSDRGYAFARFMGMFLAGWITWVLASIRIPVWSQVGIAGALLALFALGMMLLWRERDTFVTYIRQHWRRLLVIEIVTLAAFLAFLAVRLTNPDLWHDSFGGEKPMDFAYFNGVLRSTVFPPIDPWYSGGFINYYYFGYVIVGVPTLLLKMVSSIAYNLILPTLFATAGIGAFSVAFSVVNALRARISGGGWRRLGNPYLAGIAALVLAMVLGNLDTPRVALSAVANLGGYTRMNSLQDFLVEEYTRENGEMPTDADTLRLMARAQENELGDRLRYEIRTAGDILSALGRGIVGLFNGNQLYVSSERWFWGPTRILDEPPVSSGPAITEMPIFTFIYGDLHAHMISMPMQFFVFAFVLNEVLLAGDDKRRGAARWLALAVGAITVGMLRATNTWDWITYMILGVAGLSFAWWLRWNAGRWLPLGRKSLMNFAGRVGGFVAISILAVMPFTTWYTSTYNSVLPWEGNRTPLWAYFDIQGLFLFLIVSLLVWDTGRWLRSVKVASLRGRFEVLLVLALIVFGLLIVAVMLSAMSYQVSLVVVPLLLWTALLFFRYGQSRAMQFVLALVGLGLGLTLGVEYIVLAGDIGRQNTVFKFYIQAWLMFSVAGGAAFAWLVESMGRWRPVTRTVWSFVLVLLVAVASLFPLMATRGKAVYRMPVVQEDGTTTDDVPTTLDGAEFMTWAQRWEGDSEILIPNPTYAPFRLDEDYAMIRWLQENIEGTPTIIEGLGDDTQYRWNGRISIYTGLPAVLGWNFHQRQQRTLEPMGRLVEMRNANVNAFYETHSTGIAWQMLTFYKVNYVIVGRLERAYYNAEGLDKFADMVDEGLLEVVWHEGESTIYRVNQNAQLTERG